MRSAFALCAFAIGLTFAVVGLAKGDDAKCENRDWLNFGDSCYYFASRSRLSYHDAEDECRSKGAHLASVHSEAENLFIEAKINNGYGGRRWTGLNNLKGEDKFEWSDGSPIDFKHIAEKKQYKKERCYMFYSAEGGWRPEHCELRYYPVCKKSVNSVTASPLPTTVAPVEKYCPKDWLQFGQKCYKFFGAEEQERKKHKEAKLACMALGEEHDLVSIHSMKEQAFITQHLAALGTSSWIGLSHVESDEIGQILVFGWTDNSRLDFQNWSPGHPKRGTWKNCARLNHETTGTGEWLSDYCEIDKFGYICERTPDADEPVGPPEPSTCDEGYVGFRDACYKGFQDSKTWTEAEATCQSLKGHLASVADGFEHAFLYNVMHLTKPSWTGLKTVEDTRIFRWSDQEPFYYAKWASFQPKFLNETNTQCVSTIWYGTNFTVTECEKELPFICKISKKTPPKLPADIIGKCPKELSFIDIGDEYCYHLASGTSPWGTLARYCASNGLSLITITSDHQSRLLMPYVWQKSYDFWLGLIRAYDGESFMWFDNSDLNYANWAEKEPSAWSQGKDCATFSSMDSTWAVKSCSDWQGNICRAKKVQ